MKKTLLEQIIYLSLFEQSDTDDKQTKTIPDQRYGFIKSANKNGLAIAKQNGAVLSGWSAFTIKVVYTKNAERRGVLSPESDNGWSDSAGAAAALRELMKSSADGKAGQYYGPNGKFSAPKDKNGVPQYMYIVGPDVSSRKRVRKHNVWVCDYNQLFYLSKQIDQIKSLQFQFAIENNDEYMGNIVVLDFKRALKWFKILNQYLDTLTDTQKNQLNLKPINSKILIPDLSELSKDYEVEITNIKTDSEIVNITYDNLEDYSSLQGNLINFLGRARIEYDSFGRKTITPLNGTLNNIIKQNDETGKDDLGEFTGEFKNGVPWKGTLTYESGEEYTGEFPKGSVKIIKRTNSKGEPFTTFEFDRTKMKPIQVKIDKTKEFVPDQTIVKQQDASKSVDEPKTDIKTKEVTYPSKFTFGDGKAYTVYTTGPSDTFVYIHDASTKPKVWLTANKQEFENSFKTGAKLNFSLISPENQAAYKKLNALLK